MKSQKDLAIEHILDDHIVSYEIIRALLGNFLGEGAYRYVFDHPEKKNWVIKIDMGNTSANCIEWDSWEAIREMPEVAKWFAPVVKMSACGRLSIMHKANMHKPVEQYPKLIPSFFGDVKKQNFGFIGNQLVCVDYGINNLIANGTKVKLVKAVW